jgi:hypothetical protein
MTTNLPKLTLEQVRSMLLPMVLDTQTHQQCIAALKRAIDNGREFKTTDSLASASLCQLAIKMMEADMQVIDDDRVGVFVSPAIFAVIYDALTASSRLFERASVIAAKSQMHRAAENKAAQAIAAQQAAAVLLQAYQDGRQALLDVEREEADNFECEPR